MTEAYTTLENTLRFYGKTDESGKVTNYGAHMPLNLNLIAFTNILSKPSEFVTNINNWLKAMPQGAKIHANWAVIDFLYTN